MGLLKRLLTKNKTSIPLIWVEFNYKKFRKSGKKGSCVAKTHPMIREDTYIKQTIENLIDYIRDNYDMEEV